MSSNSPIIRIRRRIKHLHVISCATVLIGYPIKFLPILSQFANTVLLWLRVENFVADRGLPAIANHYLALGAFISGVFNHENLLPSRRDVCVKRLLVLTFITNG